MNNIYLIQRKEDGQFDYYIEAVVIAPTPEAASRILYSLPKVLKMEQADIYNQEDIRIALGLTDWDTFALQSIRSIANHPRFSSKDKLEDIYNKRKTGRTTRMLVEAIYYAQEEMVAIDAHSLNYTNCLVSEARDYCRKLGIPEENIVSTYDYPNIFTLTDHDVPPL